MTLCCDQERVQEREGILMLTQVKYSEFVTLQSIIENKQLQYAVLCLWSKIKALLLIIRLSWRHLVRNISCIKLKMN